LLGELNRLRDPEVDDRDDPSNLLDNSSGGKRIRKESKAAGSFGNRRLFLFGGHRFPRIKTDKVKTQKYKMLQTYYLSKLERGGVILRRKRRLGSCF
jgi:hypothetical protein